MNNRRLSTIAVVALILGTLLIWWLVKPASGVAGYWQLDEGVALHLGSTGKFSFVFDDGTSLVESVTGSYTHEEDTGQIIFDRDDGVLFTWDDVSTSGDELSFSISGISATITRLRSKLGEVAPNITSDREYVAVFPFGAQLARSLDADGGFTAKWQGMSAFRQAHSGFLTAKLYYQTEGESYRYVTVDDWTSPSAFDSFVRVFQTEAVRQASFMREGDDPGVFEKVGERASETDEEAQVFTLVLVEVPSDLREAFVDQWEMFSDFMASREGFRSAELYRSVESSGSRYDFFIRSGWDSGDAFSEVTNHSFYQAITTEGTYKAQSALYSVAATDKGE